MTRIRWILLLLAVLIVLPAVAVLTGSGGDLASANAAGVVGRWG